MPSIKIHNFGGMVPRSNRANLKGNFASYCENVDFEHGTLKGLRKPLVVQAGGVPNKTIFESEGGWLQFPGVNDIVDGLPGCLRVIACGDDFKFPSWATVVDAPAGDWVRLGLPIPEPVTVSGGKATFSINQAGQSPALTVKTPDSTVTVGSGSWNNGGGAWGGQSVKINGATFDNTLGISPVEWRAYAITYVDSFGNEGPMSLPSDRIAVDDGSALSVSIPATPGTPWDIAGINLYRAGSGHVENDKEITADDFHLVAELNAGTTAFTDALTNLEIDAEPCVSFEFTAPPAYLVHMAAEPNGTQLAGAAGREVWFCEPHEFHAWPERYRLTLDDDIVGLCWTDTGLYVLTDGNPYWVSPKADEFGYRDVFRFQETIPCASKRSICKTPDGGVCYVHKDGLVQLAGKGRASMMTATLWSESDFEDLGPSTFVATIWNGVWFGFTDSQGWMLEWRNAVYQDQTQPVQHLSLRPTALHRSRRDRFYLALQEGVCEWAKGATIMDWVWKGRLSVSPTQMNMAAYKAVFELYPHEYKPSPLAVHLRFFTDDTVLYERDTKHSRPSRLPHGWRHLGYEIEVSSKNQEPYAKPVEIREFHMASSIADLSESGNAQ
jgi:hypothetical protein